MNVSATYLDDLLEHQGLLVAALARRRRGDDDFRGQGQGCQRVAYHVNGLPLRESLHHAVDFLAHLPQYSVW